MSPHCRVGYVLKRFPRLSQTFVLNEISELRRQGVEVTVVARRPPDGHERLPDGFPEVPVHYVDSPGPDAVAALRRAGVVHLHAHFATWAARAAQALAAELGISFSFTAHAHDIYHHAVDRFRLAVSMALAEFVVTVSEANRAFLNDVLAAERRAANVVCLYNGVNLADLRPSGAQAAPGRIVSVGRLVPKKGLTHLVEACRRLKAAGRRVECVIVGDGDERGALEQQIAADGLEHDVRLAGALSHRDTLDVLRSATLCALPCVVAPDGDRDGLPTVLLEALALGVPVVSTAVSGVPEIIRNGETGLLVPPSDASALASALDSLLQAPDLRAHVALEGRRRAEADFDLSRNVATLRRLFDIAVASQVAYA